MSTEVEFSIGKEDKLFPKRLQLFFLTFLWVIKENYIWIHSEHSITFKQLLLKEIVVSAIETWLYSPTALVITKLAKYVIISVFCLIA